MRATEYSFARDALDNGAVYTMYATMVLNDSSVSANRTQLCLTPSEFTVSSNNVISSGSNKGFPLGNVMSRALTFELINGRYYNDSGVEQPRPFSTYGGLRAYFITNQKALDPDVSMTNRVNSSKNDSDIVDYYGAEFNVRLVLKQNGTTVADAHIMEGNFYVYQDADYGNVVVVHSADSLYKTDVTYIPSDIYEEGGVYLHAWFQDACSCVGLTPNEDTLAMLQSTRKSWNYNAEKPMTCREFMGYIAMMVGGNVVYKYIPTRARWEVTIQQYAMVPTYTEPSYDDKSFCVTDWFNLDKSLVDVEITGIKTVVDKEDISYGNEGYMITLTNPLLANTDNEIFDTGVTEDIQQNLIDIYKVVGGHEFRIFSGEISNFPFAEYMDVIRFYDVAGEEQVSVITSIDHTVNGTTRLANTSDSPARVSLKYQSDAVKIDQLQDDIIHEKTEREAMAEDFQNAIANSYGLYCTVDKNEETGASTWYLHDKTTLAESSTVFKMNSAGFGISADGGQTYVYGVSSSGNLIMDIISSNYILGDWIKAGKLTVADNSGNTIFEVDTAKTVQDNGDGTSTIVPVSEGAQPTVTMNASAVNITTQNMNTSLSDFADDIVENGVSKVKTSKNYTFDDEGLKITNEVGDVQNTLDETGMTIKGRNDTTGDFDVELLTVTYQGVVMDKATVQNEFTIGNWKFKEDPNVTSSSQYIGCFYNG